MPPVNAHGNDDMQSHNISPSARSIEPTLRKDSKPSIQDTHSLESAETMPTFGRRTADRPSSEPVPERVSTNMPLNLSPGVDQLSSMTSQGAQDSLSPMERFVLLSPANDPCPWETRRVINNLGLQGVSSESRRVRLRDAVLTIFGTSNRGAESVSLVAVAGSL